MTKVIDIRHWLADDGEPIPSLRSRVLWLARLIEYAGPLEVGQTRGAIVQCRRRINRRRCQALLWVAKIDPQTLEVCCLGCLREHLLIRGWEATEWAAGPMEPIGPTERERERERSLMN